MDVEYGSGKIKLLVVITAFCLLHSGSAFCLPSGLVGNGNTFGRQLRSSGNPLGHSFFDLLAVSTNEETDDGSVIESIEFPAPLTGPQQLARSAEFWKSAVPIIASYYKAAAKLKFRQDVLGECISEEEECQVSAAFKTQSGLVVLPSTSCTLLTIGMERSPRNWCSKSSRHDYLPERVLCQNGADYLE
mmetsp:Transcript_28368/g.56780  ORF Transcript_28368/g.56780 Transcript_28368/m.56780 type:complete len:189 (+) Transcript_28368:52-618(+)